MAMKLYVGGLPYSVTNSDLEEMFKPFGDVVSAAVIQDRETNRSKGFGFVEFSDNAAGQTAMKEMNGKDVGGRSLMVNEARPQEDRNSGGGSFRRN